MTISVQERRQHRKQPLLTKQNSATIIVAVRLDDIGMSLGSLFFDFLLNLVTHHCRTRGPGANWPLFFKCCLKLTKTTLLIHCKLWQQKTRRTEKLSGGHHFQNIE